MKVIRYSVVLVMFVLLAVNVQAAQPKTYAGVKIGQMMIDAGGYDDATNVGLVFGATLNEVQAGSLSIEGELTFSLVEGDVSFFGFDGDWDVLTLAGYGVYRSNGQLYFKGKAGLLYEDVSVNVSGLPGVSGDDIGLSFGIGGGYKLNEKMNLELEYTIIESDLDFLSVGLNMIF